MNQENTKSSKSTRKLKNDVIFISSLIVLLCVLGLCVMFIRGEGNSVTVTVDGELYGTYSLGKNTRVEIQTGEDNESVNVLVIEDGRAYVESASCPDGICASHKPIFRNGESIVCLPHKVVITANSIDEIQPDIIS